MRPIFIIFEYAFVLILSSLIKFAFLYFLKNLNPDILFISKEDFLSRFDDYNEKLAQEKKKKEPEGWLILFDYFY